MLLHYSVETYSFLIFDFTLAVIYVMKLDTARTYCSYEFRRCLLLEKKAMTNLDSLLKNQRHHFSHKHLHSQSYGFSSSHTWWM